MPPSSGPIRRPELGEPLCQPFDNPVTALEPYGLSAAFLAHPPEGFQAERLSNGLISFKAPLDLRTTLEEDLQARLHQLPGARLWDRLWTWNTRFIGCTSTEYAPLPPCDGRRLAQEILDRYRHECPLLIVKDLPWDSPLLDSATNAHSRSFAHALQAQGFLLLEGMPLAWVPINFSSLDAYLSHLSAARRKDIRRKLRTRSQLRFECLATGDSRWQDSELRNRCYQLYLQVYQQSRVHFDRLSQAFFNSLLTQPGSGGRVFLYWHGEELIGWNLCYVHQGKLVDKYIGLAYPQARDHNLYVLSWMHNLEWAQQQGLTHYVAGWTDSRIKGQLGARFSTTKHAVFVRNPLLRKLLHRFQSVFENEPGGGA